ncbi:hypothetical protein KBZ94_41050 [Streptomyces sp. RM72]|nr:hypothetical protein [Streptomyces sp. RM72]MBQ0891232.1 hypothetical protein [Streptomyces sp. RM72]
MVADAADTAPATRRADLVLGEALLTMRADRTGFAGRRPVRRGSAPAP